MNRWASLWGGRTKLWLPALLFVLVNLALLGGHRWVLQVRVGVQTQALNRAGQRLETLRSERESMEAALDLAVRTESEIANIRQERFATQAERLTRMMLEVKDLTRRARLQGPDNIRYQDVEIEDFGLVKKVITFTVSGSYESVRQLINLVEVADSFFVLEEIGVDESSEGVLRIGVTLSTFFEVPEGASL